MGLGIVLILVLIMVKLLSETQISLDEVIIGVFEAAKYALFFVTGARTPAPLETKSSTPTPVS